MSRLTFILCLLPLAGCVSPLQQRTAELNALVGQTEPDLVRRLGVPTRSFETGGRKFLAYSEASRVAYPDPGPPFWGPWGWRGGWYGGFPEVIEYRCETTFELGNGRVVSWSLRGNGCG